MVAKIPNCITCLRIIGTSILLFLKPYSAAFYIVYIVCGFSDILDGWLARIMHASTPFGRQLDSAADLFFYTVMAIRILPDLLDVLPTPVWIIVWCTVALRILIYVFTGLYFRRFASSHTLLNKFTGFIVFLLPFSLLLPSVTVPFGYFGAVVAAFAAIYELYIQFRQSDSRTAAS